MRIALTGTPGTGKTSIATILDKKYHIHTIHLHHFAQQENLVEDYDQHRRSDIIDLDSLNKRFIEKTMDFSLVLIDGHLSHFLDCVNMVIVLRCHPTILKTRLEEKNWSERKINENIEAEILDVIVSEAVDFHTLDNVIEIDTSHHTTKDLAALIHSLLSTNFQEKKRYQVGQIDWTDILMSDEYFGGNLEGWS